MWLKSDIFFHNLKPKINLKAWQNECFLEFSDLKSKIILRYISILFTILIYIGDQIFLFLLKFVEKEDLF